MHCEIRVCARVRGGPGANSQLRHRLEFTQVIRFLSTGGRGVSIGLRSTGREPEGLLWSYDIKKELYKMNKRPSLSGTYYTS